LKDTQRRRQRIILSGGLPNPIAPPSGCAFRTRCPLADRSAPDSVETVPELRDVGGGHRVACHLVASTGEGPRLAEEAVT